MTEIEGTLQAGHGILGEREKERARKKIYFGKREFFCGECCVS
jgi:hypothetical protein